MNALLHITASRIREFYREPAAIFWVYGFPLIMAAALGTAFRQRPTEQPISVDLVGSGVEALSKQLAASSRFKITMAPQEDWKRRLRAGKTDLVIEVESSDTSKYTLWDEPHRAESLLARYAVELALRGKGADTASDPVSLSIIQKHLEEKGIRYIDYLMPGMLGMNLMGGGLWGVGFVVVHLRTRKLLKRFLATPMRRSDFLLGIMFSRLIFTVPEVLILLGFGWLAFGVGCQGNLLLLIGIILLGGFAFAGIGLLVASRAKTVETVSGLMNLVMLPMWVLSGVFFSYERFPESVHPLLRLLPLTALNDALRGVMLDGQPAWALWRELLTLAVWGGATFLVGLRIFRWR